MSSPSRLAIAARRTGSSTLALLVLATALVLPTVPAAAVPDETFADDFSPAGFASSDGTLPWSTLWIETGESDGYGAGSIQVRDEPHCAADPCLNLGRSSGPDASVEREADLSEFAAATLTFDWDVHQHGFGFGSASLWVSANGGTDWDQLDTWLLTNEASGQTASYDISNYLASNTRIRFSVITNWDDSHLNIDNLAIEANYWVLQPTPTSEDLWTVQFPVDDQVGYVGGGNGLILKTVDGGENWVEQTTPATSTIRGIDFPVDATTGYAVGSSDTVMKTTNGVDWVMQTTPTDVTLEDVDFVDNANGFAVGDSGTILRTTDGGGTWIEKPSGTSENLRGVSFPVDAQTGYAVGTNGTILKTTDGGDSWQPQSSGTTRNLNAVQFPVDPNNGYIAANNGDYLETTNGGSDWTLSTPGSDDLRALHFPQDAQHGHVATDNGNVLATDSGGSSWNTEPVPTNLDLLGIWFTSLTRGWVVGRSGLIFATGSGASSGLGGSNLPPVFNQDLLDRTDDEGAFIDIDSSATDPNPGDTLTYAAVGLPDGIDIDPASGNISGVLTADSSGTHAVAITVTDDGVPAMVDTDNFTWTVNEGEATYLVSAEGGGAGGNEAQLSAVNRADGNPATNEVTISDSIGRTNAEGLAFQPVTNVLFASHGEQLGTIDVIAGVFTSLPSTAGIGNGPDGPERFDNIEALSFDPVTGNLYASHRPGSGSTQSMLLQINPGTGAHVPGAFDGDDYIEVQAQGPHYHVPGMAHDPTDGTLYIIHWDDIGGENWDLATVDPTTGSTTTIGPIPDDVTGLSFSGSGQLYAITDEPSDGTLYGINKTSGAVTSTITVNNTHDYEAIAIAIPPLPNLPPVFDQDLLDRTDPEGTLIDIPASATDPNVADTLTYSATGLPEGVAIDSETGDISGALGPNSAGVYSITVTVTDNGTPSLQDTDIFTWTVTPGEVTYLVANAGGANGGNDLLTAVDLTDPDLNTNEVDIGTGTGTWNIEAIALQPGTNTLFAVEDDQLGTIDVTTGVYTPRPSIAGAGNGPAGLIAFDDIEGLSFNPFSGELYGTHRRGSWEEDLLFQLDPVTGAHIPGAFAGDDYALIGSQGVYYHSADIAFDPTNGQLYLMHWDFSGNWSLATLDPATGATVTLGVAPDDVASLAFDESGRLYASTDTGGTERIYELSKFDGSWLGDIDIDNGENYEAMAIAFPVDPNRPPVFDQNLLDRTDPEGSTISLSAAATDPDGHDVGYAATGLPPGLSIDPVSGLISGTIEFAATGIYAVEITATDDGIPNLSAVDTFAWTVSELNRPPVFDQDLLDRTDPESAVISLSASATDPDADDILTYGATGLPPGLTIDPGSGLISGTIDYTAAAGSPYAVTITATDDGAPPESAIPDTFSWTVDNTNRPPVIVNPGPQTTPELAPFSIVVTASDPDGTIPGFTDSGTLPAWAVLTDNLDGTATIAGTPGGGDSGTTTVTITASDGSLDDDAVFDLTVTNTNQPPSITNPGNQFGAEGTPFSLVVTASDPDGTTVGFSEGGTLPAWATLTDNGDDTATIAGIPGYTDAGTTTVIITASDGSLTDDAVFDISISNTNRAPVVDPIADQSVAEGSPFILTVTASDPDGAIPSLSASGLPGWAVFVDNGNGTATMGGTPGYGDAAVSTITITASDGSLPGSEAFDLTVTEVNRPPTVDPVLDRFVAEGTALIPLDVSATDPDGTIPSLAAIGLPAWASFVDNGDGTGTITGTPGYSDAGVSTITIEAEDGGIPNLSGSTSFDLTVTNTNRPPVIAPIADQSVAEGDPFSITATATDPDGTIPSLSASGLPGWANLVDNGDGTGTISGIPGYSDAGLSTITVTASDGSLGDSKQFDLTVTDTNRYPVFDADLLDRADLEGAVVDLSAAATDPDLDSLSYSATGLPTGLSIDPSSGLISGTIAISAAAGSPYAVEIMVTDDGTPIKTATDTFVWTVTDVNQPPTFDQDLGDRTSPELAVISLSAGATDPDNDVLTYAATGLPPGLSIDPDSGLISGTITSTAAAGSPYAVQLVVTDSGIPTLSDSDAFIWTVTDVNRAPILEWIPDLLGDEESLVTFTASATDADLDAITYSISGAPVGAVIDPVTGVFSWTPSEAHGVGSYAVTVIATDDAVVPLNDSKVVTITVNEVNRRPKIEPIDDQVSSEGQTVTLPVVAVDHDLPANDLEFSATGLPPGLAIDAATGLISGTVSAAANGSYTVRVAVTDNASPPLLAMEDFKWIITDTNQAPILDPLGAIVGDELTTIGFTAVASDPDGDDITFSLSNEPGGASIDPATGRFGWIPTEEQGPGTYTVTVTVRDSGTPQLTTSRAVTITVDEVNEAPTISPPADQASLEGQPVVVTIDATDPDTPANALAFSAQGLPAGLLMDSSSGLITGTPAEDAAGVYEVIVTVVDDGEPALEAVTTFTWEIVDNGADEVTNEPPTINPIEDQYSAEQETISLQITATDAEPITYAANGLPPGLALDTRTGLIYGVVAVGSVGPHTVTITAADQTEPSLHSATEFVWIITDVAAVEQKEQIFQALGGFEEPSEQPQDEERFVRRSLVLMSSAAAATTESLRWPFALLLALLVGFATIGRVGLYPLLWRGEKHSGVLTLLDPEFGFGLIDPDGGGEPIFVHVNSFPRRQRPDLAVGRQVRFRLLASDNRSSAWGANMEPEDD